MDKETLSNYGWIVICVLVLAVLLAHATPFGTFVSDAVKTTTQGLFDVSSTALETVDISTTSTKTVYFENNWNWSDPKIYYWGSDTGFNPSWSGISLTETVGTTDAGYTIYKTEVPSDIDGMLFNGTGGYGFEQSEDVTDIKDGYAYYMTYTDNKKITQSYLYKVVEEETDTTSYTMEQIEADEHLYAIGKTKPEYVVAKFNDDYSEVVITKNGDDSDGKIRAFASYAVKSPISLHSNTVVSAIIKEGVIDTGSGSSSAGLFTDCTKLTTIILPNTLEKIGSNTFFYCTNLTNINIPDSVTTLGGNCFGHCKSLTTFKIPNTVTTLENGVFVSCSNLSKIYVPSSINSIAQGNVFYNIANPATIYCETNEVYSLIKPKYNANPTTTIVVDPTQF